ncbi:MAG: beta-galactosidase [Lachnotalea sp.]
MDSYGYRSKYLIKNNKPWFPIMGEMHYSRVPKDCWQDYLYKMKAGGVNVVSTYCIWIHHEEIEGHYDFDGNKDLHQFAKTCGKCGIELIVRIGPWSHGEARNGGFPDWLLKKPFQLRVNNSEYFETIRTYYKKLYEQVDGLLLKQGGPIIGVQIENEYGHCGGLQGEEGENHMKILTDMAKESGFDVPIYTATGWGGAVTGGLLPVMGGYCEAPWDARITEIEPSVNYIFTHERNDHNIGSDYGFGHGITFDINQFPFLTAELGGGLQVTKHRRPRVKGSDIGAMSLAKMGSGVNLLGYYMYCGGTNPKGILTTLQETKATGYPNDLPELSYDFQAAIGEYGQVSDTYKEIKLLAMFIRDFGEELCEMLAVIPSENPTTPNDLKHLRYSFRHNGSRGYIFVNNYQRRRIMSVHHNAMLEVKLSNENLKFPSMDIENEEYFFYPFNMKIGNTILKTAQATPLCIINKKSYVFYTDKEANYCIEGMLEDYEIITISRNEAQNAWKITLDKEYIVICENPVIQKENTIEILTQGKANLCVYPAFSNIPTGFREIGKQEEFTIYESGETCKKATVKFDLIKQNKNSALYEISIDYLDIADDYFLVMNYDGESAQLSIDNEVIADHFYYGDAWRVGLKRFGFPEKLIMEINSLDKEAQIFLEKWPVIEGNRIMRLQEITMDAEVIKTL